MSRNEGYAVELGGKPAAGDVFIINTDKADKVLLHISSSLNGLI